MKNHKIGIIGLGYVGLPLAVAFAEKYITIGFDINKNRIDELKSGFDSTLEIEKNNLKKVLINFENINKSQNNGLYPTNRSIELEECDIYIITVPTPTDKNNSPDLTPLIKASQTVSKLISKGNIVIYESTVYPGVTEDECVPILENISGLKFNKDFFVGYSPERINPGDKEHTVKKIKKVTSGSNKTSAKKIDELYKSIIEAGTHLAPSIKVAEAAKVIENSQRDINIAFINELSKIFRLLNIDTNQVLEAASTKWNFLKFQPGLVGGHCIGVDPFYLAQKAQESGYNPEIILAGRRLNDSMGKYVATETIKLLIKKEINITKSNILILGFTFKENCPDYRNTKVIDIYTELNSYGITPTVYDPWLDLGKVKKEYNINLEQSIKNKKYEAIILAVPHKEFLKTNWKLYLKENGVIFDVKGVLPINKTDGRL